MARKKKTKADPSKTIEGKRLYRSASIDGYTVDEGNRTIDLTFSSETPYERFFGNEILSHDKGAIVGDYLDNGAPLLLNHNRDVQIGVVDSWNIGDDRRGHASVRFSRSAQAEEILADIKDDIRTGVSVGYYPLEMKLIQENEEGPDDYLITKWQPLEISIASIPADITVGTNREENDERAPLIRIISDHPEERNEVKEMSDNKTKETPAESVTIDRDAERAAGVKAERERVRQITELGRHTNQTELARQFVDNGKSANEFIVALRDLEPSKPMNAEPKNEDYNVGLTQKETREYSFLRAIRAMAFPDQPKYREAAAFERECSEAAAQAAGKEPRGFMVPMDVALSPMASQRTLLDVATTGTSLKGTDHLGSSFIEYLYSNMVMYRAGMQVLSGLRGDVAVPRQSGKASITWVAESSAGADTNITIDQMTLTPHGAIARTDMSRKLLLQSDPSVEALVRADFARSMALAIDYACIHGTSPAPEGIENITGVGDVTISGAPSYADVLSIMKEVAIDDALAGSLYWMTNAKMMVKLLGTFVNSSGSDRTLWEFTNGNEGRMLGFPALVSNQILDTYVTNTASLTLFGDFSQAILGQWGSFDVLADPYTGATTGALRILVYQDVDFNVRHPESFAFTDDMTH